MRDRLNSSRLLEDSDDPSSLQTLAPSGLQPLTDSDRGCEAVTRVCLDWARDPIPSISKNMLTKGYKRGICRSARDQASR